jgi:hypothetical protein
VSREKGESRAKRFRFRLRARLSRRASVDDAKGGLLESDALEVFVIQSALSCLSLSLSLSLYSGAPFSRAYFRKASWPNFAESLPGVTNRRKMSLVFRGCAFMAFPPLTCQKYLIFFRCRIVVISRSWLVPRSLPLSPPSTHVHRASSTHQATSRSKLPSTSLDRPAASPFTDDLSSAFC